MIKLTSSIFKILILCVFGASQSYAQSTAGILPNAKTTFVDQNGKPLSSGKVYFYEPGTTTAKTTWQDIDKVTANSNPVNLDAAGRALIWGDGSYRQQVYDRNNNQQWDQTTTISGSSSGGGTTIGDGLPVGIVLPASAVLAPTNYQFTYGQALSRSTYSDLYSALTVATSITCTGGNPTISNISDTTSLAVGAVLEAICVTGSPTIISKTSSTVTLSSNATISTNITGTFFLYGNGDGSTTFNVPDYRGITLVGRCNMGGVSCSVLNSTYFSTNTNNTPSALNAIGGSQSISLLAANIPSLTSTNASQNISVSLPSNQSSATVTSASIASVQVTNVGAGSFWVPYINGNGWGNQNVSSGVNSISVTSTGTSGTAFSSISPSKTTNYIIKVTPDTNITTALISQLGGGQPNKLVGTNSSGIFGNVNLPTGLTLASSNLNFLAQACAGSTWVKSIDINGTWTCTQPAFTNLTGSASCAQLPALTGDVTSTVNTCTTVIANNSITNAKLAQAAAATIKGNPTNALANDQDFTIQGLTPRGAPDPTNDKMVVYDNAAGTLKYVTPAQVASSATSGVSSLNGLTGALILWMSPQTRLTLTVGTPVTTADVSSASSVFLEPYNGGQLTIYDGSNWVPLPVVASTYSLPATQSQTGTTHTNTTIDGLTDTSQLIIGMQVTGTNVAASTTISAIPTSTSITVNNATTGSATNTMTFKLPPSTAYDICVINNSGVPKMIWSGPWSGSTPPTRALQNGVYTCSATTQRLLGSAMTTTTAGVIADASGLCRCLSNLYNKVPRTLILKEAANTWNYSVAAWALVNNSGPDTLGAMFTVSDVVNVEVTVMWSNSAAVGANAWAGVGLDSTTTPSSTKSNCNGSNASGLTSTCIAEYMGYPGTGYHTFSFLQFGAGANTQTWYGNLGLPDRVQAGITGMMLN